MAPSGDFRKIAAFSLADANLDQGTAKPQLSLDTDEFAGATDDITVYGRRLHRGAPDQEFGSAPLRLGPATLAGSTVQTRPNRTGLTVSAAVPVSGVPGLDAVLDVFGGHEAVNATTTTPSAAVTAGFRLSF